MEEIEQKFLIELESLEFARRLEKHRLQLYANQDFVHTYHEEFIKKKLVQLTK